MSDRPVGPPQLSPDEAVAAVRRIAKAWELDIYIATTLLGMSNGDLRTVDWTDERLRRAAYLMELDKALARLNPKGGVARWIITSNPGPFFGGSAPLQMLTAGTRGMAELLRQVQRWSQGRA